MRKAGALTCEGVAHVTAIATRPGQAHLAEPSGHAVTLGCFDDWKLGVPSGDSVVDVSDVVRDVRHTGPHDLSTPVPK